LACLEFVLLGLLVACLTMILIGVASSRPLSRRWPAKEVETSTEFAAQLLWLQISMYVLILTVDLSVWSYILLEGLISLRVLPPKGYVEVSPMTRESSPPCTRAKDVVGRTSQ
jgi:hypothetical protein